MLKCLEWLTSIIYPCLLNYARGTPILTLTVGIIRLIGWHVKKGHYTSCISFKKTNAGICDNTAYHGNWRAEKDRFFHCPSVSTRLEMVKIVFCGSKLESSNPAKVLIFFLLKIVSNWKGRVIDSKMA